MIALVKKPGKLPRVTDMEPTLGALQSLVGGYIEAVPLGEDFVLIVRETGKLDGLPPNVLLDGDLLVGNVVVLGLSADADVDFRSLKVDEIDLLKIYLVLGSVDRGQLLMDKE